MKKTFSNKEIQKTVNECGLNHIAIIMDGNRRWAQLKNLPSALGHKKGVEALKNTLKACDDFGIKYLTVYAFSTENWSRTKDEVNFLMNLLAQILSIRAILLPLCANFVIKSIIDKLKYS